MAPDVASVSGMEVEASLWDLLEEQFPVWNQAEMEAKEIECASPETGKFEKKRLRNSAWVLNEKV